MAARKGRRRGYIETLPSKSFRAVVCVGTDPLTGRPRYIRETCKTLDEAKVALTRLQHQVDQKQAPKSSVTLGEAIDQWLEVADLEVTTRERYEDLIRIYIAPRLGTLQAGKLDAELLERFYARLERCRRRHARPPGTRRWALKLGHSTHMALAGATMFGQAAADREGRIPVPAGGRSDQMNWEC